MIAEELECTPGPYMLPDPMRYPAFSMSWRSPLRKVVTSAGPYDLPGGLNGPCFSIIPRQDPIETKGGGPGPSPPFSVDPIKPRAPAYTIGLRMKPEAEAEECSPGPAYYPKDLDRERYSFKFGMKHNPCIQPYITECDKEAC
ncbi:uncharacterized protein [Venturia canescens]|uniref:uncharacterized protein n=1 Tax=Venturia canescens TaxID=32260 RepID=UPI001C9D25D7|nr:uncharacterized protein LOC122414379 [Venturia canescens]